MIDLKKSYGKRYRIFMDEAWYMETAESNPDKMKDKPWYYELRGKYGKVYLYSDKNNILAVHVNSNVISRRIERENQDIFSLYLKTSEGSIFLFDQEHTEFVAKLIKAKRKRQYSPEYRQELITRAKSMRKSLIK
jgi:hypothetical protein